MLQVEALPGRPAFGALVTGLSPAMLHEPDIQSYLVGLWKERGVLVFRGIEGTEAHLRLSRVFGELEEYPLLRGSDRPEDRRWVVDLEQDPRSERGWLYEVDGQRLGGWLPWHFDQVFLDKINRGSILRELTLPERGGETGFIDRISAYDRLSPELKARIAVLNVLYRYNINAAETKFGTRADRMLRISEDLRRAIENPMIQGRSVHPMVTEQHESGRKLLNVSPWFADAIEGMETDEGDRLLREVVEACLEEGHAYYHRWQTGDMVLWDNWRMLHCGCGTPAGMSRHMQRTTITGDYGLGRFEEPGAMEITDQIRTGV